MLRIVAVVLFLGVAYGLDNIVDVVGSLQNETRLASLITQAGLTDTLKGNGPFTILAPIDAAFNALTPAEVQKFTGDAASTANLLNYHVLHGEIFSYDISSGRILKSLSGHDIRVYKQGNNIYFNNAKAVKVDIEGSNGVIYLIDSVLHVPEGTVYQILNKTNYALDQFKKFVDRVRYNHLLNTSSSSRYTVFAPSDAAFAKLDQSVLDRFLRYTTYAYELVRYHIHRGTLHLKSLNQNGKIVTMYSGHTIGVAATSNDIRLNNVAHVTVSDIEADNGVVHVIDHVLIPSTLSGTIIG